jgi:iron-sulfur cluster assembly accessory protein
LVDKALETSIPIQEVSLTQAAAQRVASLLEERGLPDHALRVFISGGGCSGLQYGMALEGEPRPDDLEFTSGGVRVLIDPMSIGYMAGATIDYVDDLMGSGFKIENPQAVASCGCGHSFRTGDRSSAAGADGACANGCG